MQSKFQFCDLCKSPICCDRCGHVMPTFSDNLKKSVSGGELIALCADCAVARQGGDGCSCYVCMNCVREDEELRDMTEHLEVRH